MNAAPDLREGMLYTGFGLIGAGVVNLFGSIMGGPLVEATLHMPDRVGSVALALMLWSGASMAITGSGVFMGALWQEDGAGHQR